jgi:hypothetical protein
MLEIEISARAPCERTGNYAQLALCCCRLKAEPRAARKKTPEKEVIFLGSGGRTRTGNLEVNSFLLHH